MSCWRFDLRRKFVPYLEGAIPPRATKRLERHLAGCEECRTVFVKVRDGHQSAQQLRRLSREDAHRPPECEAIRADIGARITSRRKWAQAWENRLVMLTTPRTVKALAGLVLVLAVLLVVSNRNVLIGERNGPAPKSGALDVRDFHPLRIPEIRTNTRARIATEGYVRDVRVDKEEGTLHFKLSEIPHGPGPFIVCEIMNPFAMIRPQEGSRVRVYGVARYDAQPGREWHEVNPVFDIYVLKR